MPFLRLGREAGDAGNAAPVADGTIWGEDVYRASKDFEGGIAASPARGGRALCGNPECAGGWAAPWRSRRRPIFEERWGCGGRCVLAMVRAAVRRESSEGAALAETPHRHRVPLGLVLLAQGWITQEQLRRALDAQREHGTGRIGDWLVAECGVGPEQVTRGLSVQWGCPVLTTEGFSPAVMARVMPRVFAEEFGMLPLRVAGSRILYLGFEDRMDASLAFAVEQMSGLQVRSGLVGETQFRAARASLLEYEGVEARAEAAGDLDALAARVTALLERKQPVASRLVRVHGYLWLRMWLEASASRTAGGLPVSNDDMLDYVFSVGS